MEKPESTGRWLFTPADLNIVWGNDGRYWKVPRDNDRPAELIQVCWLQVTGSTNQNLEEGKSYKMSFTVRMKDEAFGWKGCPVFVMAKIGRKGKYKWKKIDLSKLEKKCKFEIPEEFIIQVPTQDDSADTKLYFGFYEVWTGRWKGGLEIYSAEVQEVI